MIKAFKSVLLVGFVLLASSSQFANSQTQEQKAVAEQVDSACENSIREVRKRFQPLLADFTIIKDKENLILFGPHLEFNAVAFYEKQQIILTKGLCTRLWLINSGGLFAHMFPGKLALFPDYLSYLRDRTAAIYGLGKPGFYSGEILTFPLFANIDLSKMTSKDEAIFQQTLNSTMIESLGFVIAHEIGHLAKNHKAATGAASRRQEYEADKFAVELVEKSGFSVMASFSTLLVFLKEEAIQKRVSGTTHPRAECRMNRIMRYSKEIQKMVATPSEHPKFTKTIGMSIPEYKEVMNSLAEDCVNNP